MATPDYKTKTMTGLGTISFQVLNTGPKTIVGTLTLPELTTGAPATSQVIVTVNLNGGSTLFTGIAGAEGFTSGGYASAGDVFNVILSSSLPLDNQLNTVKSTISFY